MLNESSLIHHERLSLSGAGGRRATGDRDRHGAWARRPYRCLSVCLPRVLDT